MVLMVMMALSMAGDPMGTGNGETNLHHWPSAGTGKQTGRHWPSAAGAGWRQSRRRLVTLGVGCGCAGVCSCGFAGFCGQ